MAPCWKVTKLQQMNATKRVRHHCSCGYSPTEMSHESILEVIGNSTAYKQNDLKCLTPFLADILFAALGSQEHGIERANATHPRKGAQAWLPPPLASP